MEKKTLNAMFENLLHIGNKTNFWNAKMKPYIYGSVNGIHIINLTKTVEQVEAVKKEIEELTSKGKKVLFVGTKLQAQDAVRKIAEATGSYYVTEKWVPGLLTNWKTIKRRIGTYLKLLKDSESGAFDVLTKKEKAAKLLELEKLNKAYSGLKEMKQLPDVIFVVDGIYEEQAIKEANNLKLPVYAVFNTNGDDMLVTNFIPANTNSVKAIDYLMGELTSSVKKVAAAKTGNRVKKVADKKVSGERKVTVKKAKKTTTKAEATVEVTPETKKEEK